MMRSIAISVAVLSAVGAGSDLAVAQDAGRRTTPIPMAIDKSPIGPARAQPPAPAPGGRVQRLPEQSTAQQLQIVNQARQSFGLAYLKTMSSQDSVTVGPDKMAAHNANISVTLTAFYPLKLNYLLYNDPRYAADFPMAEASPDFDSATQPRLEIQITAPKALIVVSCQVAVGTKYVFARAGTGQTTETVPDANVAYYVFQSPGNTVHIRMAAYGATSVWRVFSCTVTQAS